MVGGSSAENRENDQTNQATETIPEGLTLALKNRPALTGNNETHDSLHFWFAHNSSQINRSTLTKILAHVQSHYKPNCYKAAILLQDMMIMLSRLGQVDMFTDALRPHHDVP